MMEKSLDGLTTAKHQVDYLYYRKKYQEACEMARMLVERTDIKGREIFDAALECALKANDQRFAEKMLRRLEQLDADDAGLKYVLHKSRCYLSREI